MKPPEPSGTEPSGPRARWTSRAWWSHPRIGTAVAIAGVVIALVALLNDVGAFRGAPTADGPDYELFDDFRATRLDPGRWEVDDPAGHFTIDRGALTAAVDRTLPGQGDEGATLTAVTDRTVQAAAFDVRIPADDGPGDGGLYVILFSESGEQRRIVVGPGNGPDDPPGYGVESCPTARCDSDIEYAGDGRFEPGRTYRVTIESTPDGVVFDIPGLLDDRTVTAIDGIREVRLYAWTNDGTSFTVQLDNLSFAYLT